MPTLISRIACKSRRNLADCARNQESRRPRNMFMNPYSFIAAVLLVLGEFQIAAFGFLSGAHAAIRVRENGLGL